MSIVYLNGEFIQQQQALVSVLDRGFLFGDGVYEVIPVYHGHLFRFAEHMQRLRDSLVAVEIDIEINLDAWQEIFAQLIKANPSPNQAIYLQITRGVGATRNHAFSSNMTPTIYASCDPYEPVSYDRLKQGFSAITLPDIRWLGCYIKSINLLPNVLQQYEASKVDATEAILIRDDYVTEGTSSNVFIVKKEKILTPPLSAEILGGITRDLILELAADHDLPCYETKISKHDLLSADEVWVTGSKREICPIVEIDHKPVANGNVGPVWEKIIHLFYECKKKIAKGEHS